MSSATAAHRYEGGQAGAPFSTQAADGVAIRGFVWSHGNGGGTRPVVVVSSATAVRCRYYARFADYLFANGFDVVTYDYRGIGESRPASLRGFRAGWADWGALDLEAVLRFARSAFPGRPIDVVAHSVGGFALGLAPSNGSIRRIVTVGSQYAYWRDYAAAERRRMYVKWHLVMPVVTRLVGYFPARRLGWMEDTPAGVALDWSGMTERFEDTLRRPSHGIATASLPEGFARVSAPILAIGLDDDPYGTPAALDRLLAYFTGSRSRHWRIAPGDIGAEAIGHFAFFHDRFRDSLWPLALAWLNTGDVPDGAPGRAAPRRLPQP